MEKDYSRNYRQYSYSETDLKDIKLAHNNFTLDKNNLEVSNNLDVPKKKLKCKISGYYIFKRLTMFIMHLSLISLFEIIFFFTIVVTFENNSFTGLIDNLASPLINVCQKLNSTEKLVLTDIIKSFINITNINNDAYISQQSRIINNNHLLALAWVYFGIITAISLITSILSLCNLSFLTKEIVINEINEPLILMNNIKIFKKHINIIKIIIDNIIMIIILGLYEYLFFKTIILKYLPISNNELIKYLFDKFNTCFVQV
jgi:hypothetical protein